jgi:hypothetical protein
MAYRVRILFLNQGEPPPTDLMDGTFATVQEAMDAGTAEVLSFQLRSTATAFQVIGPDGQIVEVTAEQAND